MRNGGPSTVLDLTFRGDPHGRVAGNHAGAAALATIRGTIASPPRAEGIDLQWVASAVPGRQSALSTPRQPNRGPGIGLDPAVCGVPAVSPPSGDGSHWQPLYPTAPLFRNLRVVWYPLLTPLGDKWSP